MGQLQKIVIKSNSIGGEIVEAHVSGEKIPVLFQRLDGDLIQRGMARRNIDLGPVVLLEDHRGGQFVSCVISLASLEQKDTLSAVA